MIQDLRRKFGIININNEKKHKFVIRNRNNFLVSDKEYAVCYFFCLDSVEYRCLEVLATYVLRAPCPGEWPP